MIIYYHCNSDNALLLSFLLTCHHYIHPLSFHEMIFILVPPVLCIRRAELSHAHAQQKMTTPSRRTRGPDEQWRFILTSVEVSLELLILYILCERHEGSLSEKAHRVPQLNRFM